LRKQQLRNNCCASNLLLNSPYGKFGMKDIISTMKIVDIKDSM
jgi:hypothetical protein